MNAPRLTLIAAFVAAMGASPAHADAVTDWNVKSGEIITEAKLGTPPAIRVMAVVQTAAYQAAKSVGADASMEAAIAAAHHATLTKLIPSQVAAIEAAYQTVLAGIPEGSAKLTGIDAGKRAAAMVLAMRADDTIAPESYRPRRPWTTR